MDEVLDWVRDNNGYSQHDILEIELRQIILQNSSKAGDLASLFGQVIGPGLAFAHQEITNDQIVQPGFVKCTNQKAAR
jgi:hypothetical protein